MFSQASGLEAAPPIFSDASRILGLTRCPLAHLPDTSYICGLEVDEEMITGDVMIGVLSVVFRHK